MRIARQVELSAEERLVLEQRGAAQGAAARLSERCRIVLLAAAGRRDIEIAAELKVSVTTAARWRARFLQGGVAAVMRDRPRPGRAPSIGAELVARIIGLTAQQPPNAARHWTTRAMAAAVGISEASVRRIWRAHGLKPHLRESADPAIGQDGFEALGRPGTWPLMHGDFDRDRPAARVGSEATLTYDLDVKPR